MDIVFSSATDLANAIRAGEVSSVEVVEAHLAHIEKHNPALNAIVTLDEALARREVWGPLHGVPFMLKDARATAGMRSTVGFPPLNHIPE